MKTVRITLALAVALAMTAPLMAQEKKAAKGKGTKISPIARAMLRTGKIHDTLADLDLTAEQKEKLGKIHKELGPKVGEVSAKLEDILTEEQLTAAGEAAKKAKEAGKEIRAGVVAIEAAVKATDEQKEKLDALAKELVTMNREMTKAIRGILTPEQKEKWKKALAPKVRKPREKKDKPAEKK